MGKAEGNTADAAAVAASADVGSISVVRESVILYFEREMMREESTEERFGSDSK